MLNKLELPPEAVVVTEAVAAPLTEPVSHVFEVTAATGRALSFRQWLPEGLRVARTLEKQPVLLLVHGLGGRSSWMAPMAALLLEDFDWVYGVNINRYGENPDGFGHFDDSRDLVREVWEAVSFLADRHETDVHVIGLSLGALVATHVAADPPAAMKTLSVISPAYDAARESFNPKLYAQVILRNTLEKCRLLPSGKLPLPYAYDLSGVTRNQEIIARVHETENRVMELTVHAYMELLKMTVFRTRPILNKIRIPVLMFVAAKDIICCPKAMIKTYKRLPSPDKKLVVFPEAYHDLVFEPEMPAMVHTMRAWLRERTV